MLWDTLTSEEQEVLTERQLQAEQAMLMGGKDKYWKEYTRAPDEGIPEQQLLDSAIEYLEPFYQEWIDKTTACKKTPAWVHPLIVLGARKMADLTVRCLIKCWLSNGYFGFKNDTFPHSPPLAQTVCRSIAKDAVAIVAYQQAKKDFKGDWERQSKFIKNWSPKRCMAFVKKVSEIPKMTLKQQEDFGHHMLRIAEKSSVVQTNRIIQKSGKRWIKKLHVSLDQKIIKELYKRHKSLETTELIFRPMLVPPVPHTMERSGGYLTPYLRKEVVHRFLSNYYGEERREQKFSEPSPLVLEGLNAMGNTEWTVNQKVLEVMTNLFKANTKLGNLPAYDFSGFEFQEEYPLDGLKEDQAKWCQRKEEAWGDWFKGEQKRARMLVRLDLADQLSKESMFYMPYTLDFRGRGYGTCELLCCQGSDFDLSLIQFAESVEQTEEGLFWLKVYLANLFDQDKFTLDDRVKWVDDNMEMFEAINKDPYTNKEWLSDKKKKNPSFTRLKVIFDLCRTDGLTQIDVHIDGKCNGTQHWAGIMRDSLTATLTNLNDNKSPEDLYGFVANKTTEVCYDNKDTVNWYEEFLDYWSDGIQREVTKRPTMCDSYGLTFYGIQKYVKSEGHLDWVDKDRVGGAVVELARAIQSSLSQTLEMPNKGKDFLKECATVLGNDNKHIEYTTPSGFKVVHSYNMRKNRRSLASLFNHKELTFYTYTEDVDIRKAVLSIAPNYIHSLDAAHMFLVIYRLLKEGIFMLSFIHDSYGVHAPYVQRMRDITRQEFVKIHEENQLQVFKEEIERNSNLTLPSVPGRGGFEINRVLESDYLFS